MGRQSFKTLSLVLAMVAAVSVPALSQAQLKGIAEMTCDFNVEDTTLPAGRYSLEQINPDQYVLRSPALKVSVVFLTTPSKAFAGGPPQAPELVFNVYGDRYFLRTVKILGDAVQRDLTLHSTEKELMAKGATKTEFRCVMEPGPPK